MNYLKKSDAVVPMSTGLLKASVPDVGDVGDVTVSVDVVCVKTMCAIVLIFYVKWSDGVLLANDVFRIVDSRYKILSLSRAMCHRTVMVF